MVWDLNPVLATVFGRDVYWYGIMLACGVVHGGWYMIALLGADEQRVFLRLASLGTLCAVVFARLAHFAFYDPAALAISPWSFLDIRNHPGWSSHGAVIGLVLSVALLARFTKGIETLVLLGQCAVGSLAVAGWVRIGNFFQSEIVGRVTDLPWAIVFTHFDRLARHPVQLYEAVGYFFFFSVFERQRRSGRIARNRLFLVVGLVISAFRFLVEFFKESELITLSFLALTPGQWASAGTGIAFAAALAGQVVSESSVRNRHRLRQ